MQGSLPSVVRRSVQTVSLNREEKAVVIEEVSAEVAKAQSIIIAEYRGLDVASVTVLRKTARESGVYLRVLKNTLVRRALDRKSTRLSSHVRISYAVFC